MTQHLFKNSFLRGVLFLLLCIVGIGNTWGEEVTVTLQYSDVIGKGTSGGGGRFYHTISPIFFNFSNAYGNDAHIKSYGSSTITFFGATITKIVITATSSTYIKTWNDGTNDIKVSSKTATWTGSANSVTLKNTATDQARITSIAVTYEKDANAPIMEHIAISETPAKTSYYIDEKPSANGLIVSAVYSDDSETDITDFVTWTFSPETITEETTQVTATASYNGLTDSHTYSIVATRDPRIKDYTLLEDGKKYYIGATKGDTDYFFTTPYTTTKDIRNSGSTDRSNATIVTAIVDNSSNNKWAFQFDNGNYLSLPATDKNGYISIVSSEIYWTLSNDTKEQLIRMTTDGTHYLQINNTSYSYFGSYKNTQTNIWFFEVPTFDVEISSAGYATFCLPYNATVPSGLTAYTATDNGETVKLTAIESGKIAAGEGVVLKGKGGTYTFVATAEDVSATEGNQMVGMTEDTPLTSADNAYMLTRKKDDGSIAFRLLATDYTMGANKAYLKLENNARNLISVVWDDNATGIYDLSEKEEAENGAIYNLAGQKLIRAQKGINIINGKLVIK